MRLKESHLRTHRVRESERHREREREPDADNCPAESKRVHVRWRQKTDRHKERETNGSLLLERQKTKKGEERARSPRFNLHASSRTRADT